MTDTITLDPVEVTAPAPAPTPAASPAVTTTNPTASTAYKPQPPAGGDDLTLTVGDVSWVGWQRVQLTRSMDTVPANFDIMVTERYPNAPDIDIKPGAPCTVKLGGDLVLTGFIDRYDSVVNAREHNVHISGRSKSQDLVDCAAFVGGQDPAAEQYSLTGSTTKIITDLAKAYGITVNSQAGDGITLNGPVVINLGETAWEIIDRMTKYAQVVAYDMPDGSLMLAQAGEEKMASGFQQGVNVEQAEVNFTMDQRYSVYEGFATPVVILSSDKGGHQPPKAIQHDIGARSFRKRIIVSTAVDTHGSMLQALVDWEMNRRAGRSQAVSVTCDSWRDTSGNLWAPNHLAPVDIPAVKVSKENWVIGQVTYTKDERGRHAIVLLMPKGAFLPQPIQVPGSVPTAGSLGIGPSNPTAKPPDAPATPEQPNLSNYATGTLKPGGALGGGGSSNSGGGFGSLDTP